MAFLCFSGKAIKRDRSNRYSIVEKGLAYQAVLLLFIIRFKLLIFLILNISLHLLKLAIPKDFNFEVDLRQNTQNGLTLDNFQFSDTY